MTEETFTVRVGGEYACFSRPEFKVERVSYPIITPSAARGAIEAVFWKPEIRYEILSIALMKPIKQTAILRNEIGVRQGAAPVVVEDHRQQRASLILKDVEYLIRFALNLRAHARDPITKYREQLERRLERGQWHHTPYLGTREFAARIEPGHEDASPIQIDMDIGQMLFDIAYHEDPSRPEMSFHRHGPEGARVVKGYAEALFFAARLRRGILDVPADLYQRLYQMEDRHA